jgi:hypothetical protein
VGWGSYVPLAGGFTGDVYDDVEYGSTERPDRVFVGLDMLCPVIPNAAESEQRGTPARRSKQPWR